MTTARLAVWTVNVGRGVGQDEARNNIHRVIRGTRPTMLRRAPAAIGWQEIDEADQPNEHGILHHNVRQLTPGADIVGFRTACPIVIPVGWEVIRQRIDKTCDGRAKLTPQRVCVQALIEHQDTGLRLVLLNGHYPRSIPALMDLWHDCQNAWEAIVDKWGMDGYTVVTTRDRNLPGNRPALSPWEVPLLPALMIDKITVVQATPGPRAVRVHAGKPRTIDLTIDGHNAHGVPFTVTPLLGPR